MTKEEIKALNELHNNDEIIIKKGDKGAGIVIMDRSDYEHKIYDLLSDSTTYTLIENDITEEIKKATDMQLKELEHKGYLSQKQYKNLTNYKAQCPKFYGVPKVHKLNCPLRPIVSQMNGPTRKLHDLLDTYLAVAEKQIPYLLQDTTAFLNLLNQKQHQLTEQSILVTFDVVSLYTNIPQDEGTAEVSSFYEETLNKWTHDKCNVKPIQSEELAKLLLFTLQSTVFKFQDKYYKQNYGCTMGAQSSVKFANIYMHKFLTKFQTQYNNYLPDFLARLVDDIFTIWNSDLQSLLSFTEALNSFHPTIKFELKYSYTDIQFLDTIVYIENNKLKTKLYIKPTDKKQYLHFTSSHPQYTKTAIPYSQALRYRRIITEDSILQTELAQLQHKFSARQYPKKQTSVQISKALSLPREHTLIYKTKEQRKQDFQKFLKGDAFLPLIVTYHPSLQINRSSNIRKTLLEYWQTLLSNDSELEAVFTGSLPQIVYKKHKTLSTYLTSAEHPPRWQQLLDKQDKQNINTLVELIQDNKTQAVTKCNHPRCKCCTHITDFSHLPIFQKFPPISTTNIFTCNSQNIIYVIHCSKCHLNYVGETRRPLRERLNNHRSTIVNNKKTAIAIHFNLPQHNILNLQIMPVEQLLVNSDNERKAAETRWIKKLQSIYPLGLNNYPILYNNPNPNSNPKP